MTNTTYFSPVYAEGEYVVSSSSEVSQQINHTDEEVTHNNSSSLYKDIRKKIRAWISPRQRSELRDIAKLTTTFSYAKLRTATGNFKADNKLGEGGFGPVYKGILSDGREIAVKKLLALSPQGKSQFLAEISIVSALQHRNLVKLHGCCIEGENRLLVYEYHKNRSLDQVLFGKGTLHLDWKQRYNICLGIARGLVYLHLDSVPRIIHRDVKSSNILLDSNLNAKISDFGLAKLYDDEDAGFSSTITGTFGYIAPEYAMHGRLTDKVDVFGFGIVALEILCGRQNTDSIWDERKIYLVELASSMYKENHGLDLVDPKLTSFNHDEAIRMLGVAILCTQKSPKARPSMSLVVAMLTGATEVSTVTEKPIFSDWESTDMNSIANKDWSSGSSTSKAPIIQLNSASNAHIGDELLEINNMTSFSYAELRTATGDFSSANKLGEGEVGSVYKGKLTDEREVAVKRFLRTTHQEKSEFEVEIAVISSVQHINIVKMYGCCVEGDNRLIVYEYLNNKSLDKALFGNTGLYLDWKSRYNICIGTARGLAYFHEESNPRIIHRDVKGSNILLDSKLNPKISDLCLAKLHDDTKTHVSTRVGGTIGYIAPEYAMHGHLTEKVDVFGFGVVALEILCGRQVIDSKLEPEMIYLLELVWSLYEHGRSLEIVDPTLTSFNGEEAIRLLGVALLCTQASPKLRPTMSQVVAMLTTDIDVISVSEKPSYLIDW